MFGKRNGESAPICDPCLSEVGRSLSTYDELLQLCICLFKQSPLRIERHDQRIVSLGFNCERIKLLMWEAQLLDN
jgi:predicted methyltransferase